MQNDHARIFLDQTRLVKLDGRRGTYALVLRIERLLRVRVGKLGMHHFALGIWVYMGSAMGNGATSLGHRLRRHFAASKKKRWHIDYLLSGKARPLEALWIERESCECGLASALRDSRVFEPGPSGFGSGDCRAGCGTHLFRYTGRGGLRTLRTVLRSLMERDTREPPRLGSQSPRMYRREKRPAPR